MDIDELIAFERDVADAFERGEIRGPVHLSGGNESLLIEIFRDIQPTDWVFSTYRSHYHALLHGVPPEKVMAGIMAGKSMNLNFPEHRFMSSAIVGGCLPIAVGVAEALKRDGLPDKVWCFVGDMAARTGAFHDASSFGGVRFVVENNGFSCNSPTDQCWPEGHASPTMYFYTRTFPHVGIGKHVQF